MATIRQKRLAKAIVENLTNPTPLTKQELVVSSGYTPISAESSAHIIIEQKGVQEELKALGFTEENAMTVVTEIMLNGDNDPNARLKATDQVFKVHGSYAPEKHNNTNLNIDTSIPEEEKQKLLNLLGK